MLEGFGYLSIPFELTAPSTQYSSFYVSVSSSDTPLSIVYVVQSYVEIAPFQTTGNITLNIVSDGVYQGDIIYQVVFYGFSEDLESGNIVQLDLTVLDFESIPEISFNTTYISILENSTESIEIEVILSVPVLRIVYGLINFISDSMHRSNIRSSLDDLAIVRFEANSTSVRKIIQVLNTHTHTLLHTLLHPLLNTLLNTLLYTLLHTLLNTLLNTLLHTLVNIYSLFDRLNKTLCAEITVFLYH